MPSEPTMILQAIIQITLLMLVGLGAVLWGEDHD